MRGTHLGIDGQCVMPVRLEWIALLLLMLFTPEAVGFIADGQVVIVRGYILHTADKIAQRFNHAVNLAVLEDNMVAVNEVG